MASSQDHVGTAGTMDSDVDTSSNDTTTKTAQLPILEDLRTASKKIRVHGLHAFRPLKSFNPTAVRLSIGRSGDTLDDESKQSNRMLDDRGTDVAVLWRARDHRKGRQSIAIRQESIKAPHLDEHEITTRLELPSRTRQVMIGIMRMFTYVPYWDMAYWVGFWFTLGSIIWVVNGFMAWLPVAFPSTDFNGELEYGVGLTSFLGVLAFQVGATLAYLEAVNEGCWHGSMMRRVIDGYDNVDDKAMIDYKLQSIMQSLRPLSSPTNKADIAPPHEGTRTAEKPAADRAAIKRQRRGAVDLGVDAAEGSIHELLPFRWWPTWRNLRDHHAYEVGFLACTTQFVGATIFIITGVVALPGILNNLKPWQENLAYWIPQMIASVGFIVGSLFFVLESQEKWWRPEPGVLGWWIGAWALAGSVGFELCAAFGPASYWSTGMAYQSALTSLWGSLCFLISSVLQFYEAVNKHPIEELKHNPGELKSWQVHPL